VPERLAQSGQRVRCINLGSRGLESLTRRFVAASTLQPLAVTIRIFLHNQTQRAIAGVIGGNDGNRRAQTAELDRHGSSPGTKDRAAPRAERTRLLRGQEAQTRDSFGLSHSQGKAVKPLETVVLSKSCLRGALQSGRRPF
jgi:hypothetical protein